MNFDGPRTNLQQDVSLVPAGRATFLDYFLLVVTHRKLIVGVTLTVAVLSVIISLLISNVYTARTQILPLDDDKGLVGAMLTQMGGLAALSGDVLGGKSKTELYATILKSEAIQDRIIHRFNLMAVYEVKLQTKARRELARNTKITTNKKDGVITVAVDHKDPKVAADMANAYVEELQKLTVQLNMSGAGSNRAFLEKKIAETRIDLANAEDAVKMFQIQKKAISVTDQAKATIEGVSQLKAELAVKEVELATLRRQYTDFSQEVKNAKTTIGNLRTQIAALEDQGGNNSAIPTVAAVPALGQEYLRLMRELKVQEAVLEMLVKQHEVASLSESKDVSPLQVIQVATPPELKSKPKRARIVLVMTFLGFLLAAAFVCLKDMLSKLPDEENQKLKQILVCLGKREEV